MWRYFKSFKESNQIIKCSSFLHAIQFSIYYWKSIIIYFKIEMIIFIIQYYSEKLCWMQKWPAVYYKRKLIDDQIILKELNIKKNDTFIIISPSFLKSKNFTKARPLPLSFKDCDINVNYPTLKTQVEKEFSQEKERELREIEVSLGEFGRNTEVPQKLCNEFLK